MLFRQDVLQGIVEGRVTLAFRRWRRAPPADGSTLRSPAGVIHLEVGYRLSPRGHAVLERLVGDRR